MNTENRNRSPALSVLLLSSVLLFIFPWGIPEPASASRGDLKPLQDRLAMDGFKDHEIRILDELRPAVLYKAVSQTFRMRESKLNYSQFLEPLAINKAQEFRRMYAPLLTRAEVNYGVDHRVIVAILLVETRFGSYTGKTPTWDILITFALMEDKKYRDGVWPLLSARDRKRWDRTAFDSKLVDRSRWAYGELCALLLLTRTRAVETSSFRGSVMGAVGWPQFLPSSLLRYGVDGDGNGRIDLFEPTDAVFSVANYLKGYGWREGGTRADKEKVIYEYNHSRPYVEAILGIAEKLKDNDRLLSKP